jgi:hypothetical protein
LQPEKLMVYATYTRRGGLDINPCRVSDFMDAKTNSIGTTIKRIIEDTQCRFWFSPSEGLLTIFRLVLRKKF